MKSKFLKFVSVLCVLVIIVSSSLFSVSAANSFEELNITFGDTVIQSIVLLCENIDTGETVEITFNRVTDVDTSLGAQVQLTNSYGFAPGERYVISVGLVVQNEAFLNSSNYVSGSYRLGFAGTRFRFLKDSTGDSFDYKAYTYRSHGIVNTSTAQFGEVSYFSSQYNNYADCVFSNNRPGEVYDFYFTQLYITSTTSFKTFSLFLYYWDFDVISQSEKAAQDIINNQNQNTNSIINNQNQNTDKILGAGSDVPMPDFNSTNNGLNGSLSDYNSVTQDYVLDENQIATVMNDTAAVFAGSDMQKASVQVKNWVERFVNENTIYLGFISGCLGLALCFWIIGRKGWERN